MKPESYPQIVKQIIDCRIQFDEEEIRLTNQLRDLKSRKLELTKRCYHLSALKQGGKVHYCPDCGFGSNA